MAARGTAHPPGSSLRGSFAHAHAHMNGSSRGAILPPTPCERNGALGITDSPVHPPAALPWLRGPSKCGHTGGSTVKDSEEHCIGPAAAPPPPQALQGHFPDPPWQGGKGRLRRNRCISSLHWEAMMMESFCCSVQRAQYNALWETTLPNAWHKSSHSWSGWRTCQSCSTGQEGFLPHLLSIRCRAAMGQCRYQSSASRSPEEEDIADGLDLFCPNYTPYSLSPSHSQAA